MKRLILVGMVSFLGVAGATHAEVLTLTPTADSFVDALDPDTAFGTGDLEAAMTGPVGEPATELTFLFTQYQLPEGMTGQSIASINSVDFVVRRTATSAKLNTTYYVYGVFDGIDTESADTYTWNDSVGFDETHNEVRFPPNPDEISYYTDPAESAYIGSLDTSSSGPQDRPFGFVDDVFQGETALQNRRETILQDTDGRITLYMKCRVNFDVTPLQKFASLEHPTSPEFPAGIAPPTLIIDFEPGSQAITADFDSDGDVDGADFLTWQSNFGLTGTADLINGDANDDNNVDDADLAIWRGEFGNTTATGSASAVPEPAVGALAIAALAAIATTCRRAAP